MSDQFTVYPWYPENRRYLKRVLSFLERLGGRNPEYWIERKRGFFGFGAPNFEDAGPGERVLIRNIEVEVDPKSTYVDPVAFYWDGNHAVHYKVAFHYGRCMLYICLITDKAYITKSSYIVCVILHDRQTDKWYWCGSLGGASSLESFLAWMNHHI